MDFDKLISMRNKINKFDRYLGIQILEIREGYAKGEIEISRQHMNIIDSIHGGCTFSLVDTVAGAAALSHGELMTTVSANINYLSPTLGVEKLIAEAVEIKHGKKISVYEVTVTDGSGVVLATSSVTYYNLNMTIESKLNEMNAM